jgi:hypothetical protein
MQMRYAYHKKAEENSEVGAMSGLLDHNKGLRWTAFAALVAVAVLAFAAGWMLPMRAPDGTRDAGSHGPDEHHAVLNSPAQEGAVTRR